MKIFTLRKLQKKLLGIVAILCCFSVSSYAATASPVGYWAVTNVSKENTIVRIKQENGALVGRIYRVPGDQNAVCQKCTGDLHMKPLKGLAILWGFRSKDNRDWDGGKVLAPRMGEVFDADLTTQDGGQELRLTLHTKFGDHEQIWQRVGVVQ